MKQRTIDFVNYLISGGLVKKETLSNPEAMSCIDSVISSPDIFKDNKSASVQMILSEFSEWCELYPQE